MKQIETDISLPSWFQELVDEIKDLTLASITDPIVELYAGPQIEGWSIPPFQCCVCGAKFSGDGAENDYAAHMVSHITAFNESWFEGV